MSFLIAPVPVHCFSITFKRKSFVTVLHLFCLRPCEDIVLIVSYVPSQRVIICRKSVLIILFILTI